MSQKSLLEEIEEFRTTKILPKISAQISANPEEIQVLGKEINRFFERATTGQEQILLGKTRDLLADIPRISAGESKYSENDASKDYVK